MSWGQPLASEPQFTPVAPIGSGGELGLPWGAQRTEAAIPHVSCCPGSQALPLEDTLLPPRPRSPQLLFRSPACCSSGQPILSSVLPGKPGGSLREEVAGGRWQMKWHSREERVWGEVRGSGVRREP